MKGGRGFPRSRPFHFSFPIKLKFTAFWVIFAYPIANPELHLADWWHDPDAFSLLVREYGKYLLTVTRLAVSPQAPPATGTAG